MVMCSVHSSESFKNSFFAFFADTELDEQKPSKESTSKQTFVVIKQVLIIVVVCAGSYLIISILLIFYCKKNIFKRKRNCNSRSNPLIIAGSSEKNSQITKSLINANEVLPNSGASISESNQYENIVDSFSKSEIKAVLGEKNNKLASNLKLMSASQFSISTNFTLRTASKFDSHGEEYLKSLHNFTVYGKCCYGEVYLADSNYYKCYSKKQNTKKNVILKILTNVADENAVIEFYRDIETFSKLSHENIVKLIDICTNKEGQAPNIVILEHSDFVSKF